MTTAIRSADIPRSPVFNAVTAGLLLISAGWLLIIASTPVSPLEMMVPWARGANMLQAVLGAACVTLIWFRQAWAFYVYVGLIMFGILVGLIERLPLLYLVVGPAMLGLYLWALHSGSPSMWVQMFGRAGAPGGGRGIAYGMSPAMPPTRSNMAPPPLPPTPSAPRPPVAPAAAPAAVAPAPPPAAPTGMNPIEALKRLASLRDAGAITEAEFAAKKAELLQRL